MGNVKLKPGFRFRRLFLATSWLGPFVGLLAWPRVLEILREAGKAESPLDALARLMIPAVLYLGLMIVPWITKRATTITDFREVHAFGSAVFLTYLAALLSGAAGLEIPMQSLMVFIASFFLLRGFYKRVEANEGGGKVPD